VKNQYFGDINDYKKYSLLRHLIGNGEIKTVVCWVLTEDDSGSDGRRIKYLEQPETWQKYDPIVFEHLRKHVVDQGIRHTSVIERSRVLRNCRFYNELLDDNVNLRNQFFDKFSQFAQGAELVFFDPDNGLEVKSVPRGKKKSSKYIYWSEVEASYKSGHSLLIYQHFPRKPREQYIRCLIQKFKALEGVRRIFSFCTFHVAFLLIPQPNHESMFAEKSNEVSDTWGEVIKVREHRLASSVAHI
jgi:hypothetical protein